VKTHICFSFVVVYFRTEHEINNGIAIRRKGVVEEYLQGGAFPAEKSETQCGETEYAGTYARTIPSSTAQLAMSSRATAVTIAIPRTTTASPSLASFLMANVVCVP
jgi:hypothetical protein